MIDILLFTLEVICLNPSLGYRLSRAMLRYQLTCRFAELIRSRS